MDKPALSDLSRPLTYQLCRIRTSAGDVDLVLNLFVGREMVSVTTIARLSIGETEDVLICCIAHLEKLGILPVADATACDRTA